MSLNSAESKPKAQLVVHYICTIVKSDALDDNAHHDEMDPVVA